MLSPRPHLPVQVRDTSWTRNLVRTSTLFYGTSPRVILRPARHEKKTDRPVPEHPGGPPVMGFATPDIPRRLEMAGRNVPSLRI
jgi:hypothetical protein